jgi:hypothetical protein
MKTFRRFVTASALTMATAYLASATTIIVNSGPYSGSFTSNFAQLNSPGSNSVTLQQFDVTDANSAIQSNCPVTDTCSALSLNSINFSINGNILGSLTFNNSATMSQRVTGDSTGRIASAFADLYLVDPNGVTVAETIPAFTLSTNFNVPAMGSVTKTGNGSDPETGTINAATGAVSTSVPGNNDTLTPTEISSTYEYFGNSFNASTNTIVFDGTLGGGVSLPGNFPNGVTNTNNSETLLSSSSVGVQYVYSYTDTLISTTPEPATLVLFGSALIGIGLIRKRVRQ